MATRIPLPDNNRSGLFEGLMAGHKRQDVQQGMQMKQQQHEQMQELKKQQLFQALMQHEQNLALKQQAEQRRGDEFNFKKEMQPWQMDAIKAKIDQLKANAEKARRPGGEKQTPEEKAAQRMNEFKEKEQYKAEQKANSDKTKPTQAVITQNQNIVAAVNNLIPQIHKIKTIKTPNLVTGKAFDSDKYATYKTETDKAADSLMSAFKWLGIEASLDMAKDMTKRMPNESEANYHARLDSLLEEMVERQNNAYSIYSGASVKPHSRSGPSEGTPTKTANSKEYDQHSSENSSEIIVGIDANGKKWELDPEDVQDFIAIKGNKLA